MFALALTCFATFVLLLTGEFLWKVKKIKPEFSRKFTHIAVGIFAAFWPWFLSWRQIEAMSVAFLVVVLISRGLKIFRSIHLVERRTIGEILYAISIGLTALITHDKYIFAAAILTMSLADGLAAVVGLSFGKRGVYKIFGMRKTLAGTLTFWCCSFIILSFYFLLNGHSNALPILIFLPVATALLENLGIFGIDNLLVPLATVLVLKAF